MATPPTPAPTPYPPPPAAGAKNVLLLIVDDLRPQVNETYGNDFMITPHLEKFAKGSTTFHRAYVQISVCAPSRNSFMTGRRPDRTKCLNFKSDFRRADSDGFPATGANWISMPEYFKENGFLTLGGGKSHHPNLPPDYDEPKSWSQDMPNLPFKEEGCGNRTAVGGHICPGGDLKDEDFLYYQLTDNSIKAMHLALSTSRKFFVLGVKQYAFMQFPRCGINGTHPWTKGQKYACIGIERTKFDAMGYAIRSDCWQYIEWRSWNTTTLLPDWSDKGLLASGLYDHRNDTGAYGPDFSDWAADYVNMVGDTSLGGIGAPNHSEGACRTSFQKDC